jgi:vancomycin resistance protein YoaR
MYRFSPELSVPVGEWPADRTTADLEGYGVQQAMASFYTDVAGGNPDRANNIKLGSASINGTLMAPGEIFSFSDTVGRITREKGYRDAPIIVGDELVPGLGGGLCQVSTTLYNAVLYANLDIIERHNHSMSISYIPLGRDATVAIGSLDLKFKNNRDHYIIIGAELNNLRLTFRIFGPPMDEKVEIISSDYQQIAPSVQYEYSEALPSGATEIVKPGISGFYITTWRIVYMDEQEISREMLGRDYYRPTPALYRVGTGGGE